MRCNYDNWSTAITKSITPKERRTLEAMRDGVERTRSDMLWAARIDPNPRSKGGYAGFEKTDYYLYKKGLLELVGMFGQQKIFKITQAGLEEIN